MHIAIAGGHSANARGASGFIDEYDCDRAFVAQLVPAFESQGWYVTDCSNDADGVNIELAEECRIANASGADLFIAVHFNAGGGTGTEVWHYPGSSAESYAESVSAELASALGLRNRGAKSTTGLYVLNRTTMPAILIEVCFVDTEQDADAWHATSWDALCGAVVRGLGGEYDNDDKEEENMDTDDIWSFDNGGDPSDRNAWRRLCDVHEAVSVWFHGADGCQGLLANVYDTNAKVTRAMADNAAAIENINAKLDAIAEKLG